MSRESNAGVSQHETEKRMDKEYIAVLLIEILFEKGLVNQQTYCLHHVNCIFLTCNPPANAV